MDSKEIQPVNPKEINPEYSLEGLMLKLNFQYFGHLRREPTHWEKTLMLGSFPLLTRAGGEGGNRG